MKRARSVNLQILSVVFRRYELKYLRSKFAVFSVLDNWRESAGWGACKFIRCAHYAPGWLDIYTQCVLILFPNVASLRSFGFWFCFLGGFAEELIFLCRMLLHFVSQFPNSLHHFSHLPNCSNVVACFTWMDGWIDTYMEIYCGWNNYCCTKFCAAMVKQSNISFKINFRCSAFCCLCLVFEIWVWWNP